MGRSAHDTEYKAIRLKVMDRDNNCCVKCGWAVGLEVHHIKGYKHNEIEELATLCYLCHNIAPMGEWEFSKWLLSGDSGIEVVENKFSQNGINGIPRLTVRRILESLVELGIETNKLRMKVARDRVRKSGIRCEGRLPYGHHKEEKFILEKMMEMRRCGFSYEKIADYLNTDGFVSRYGGKWRKDTIGKILKREMVLTK